MVKNGAKKPIAEAKTTYLLSVTLPGKVGIMLPNG